MDDEILRNYVKDFRRAKKWVGQLESRESDRGNFALP